MLHPYFFIRFEKQYVKINICEVTYIEAEGNYVTIYLDHAKYMTLLSLRQLTEVLPASHFVKISRSIIVCLDRINSFDRDFVHIKDKRLTIGGTNFRTGLERKVNIIMSDVRDAPGTVSNEKVPALYTTNQFMSSFTMAEESSEQFCREVGKTGRRDSLNTNTSRLPALPAIN